jgi:glycosyltransferase involved in cell wall biosynthesis
MFRGYKICAVVPCYNEVDTVGKVIAGVPEYVDNVVVIDDGSTDGTTKAAVEAKDQRLTTIRHETRQGVGSAIVSGHKKAIELGADISAVLAGDDQMDPKFLPGLLSAIIDGGYDYSKGNRYLRAGHLQGMPGHRVFGNILLTFMTKLASGYWNIFDPQNGYTCVRVGTLQQLDLDRIDRGYNFENDMLVHLNIIGASVVDVPCSIRYAGKKSGIRTGRFVVGSIGFMLKAFTYRLYKKYIVYDFGPYPLLFFPGLVIFLVGLWFSLQVTYLRYFSPAKVTASTGTIILGAIGLVLGLQLLLTAFIFDALQVPRPKFPREVLPREESEQD